MAHFSILDELRAPRRGFSLQGIVHAIQRRDRRASQARAPAAGRTDIPDTTAGLAHGSSSVVFVTKRSNRATRG
jgi:hypothetical protein